MKAMVIRNLALVALVFCVGALSQRPSSAEFNLFCRILAKADDLMYGPGYSYDDKSDKEIIKEMTVLYNATTDNMEDFRRMLWETKDFFEEHPPPTDPKNRQAAHREIGNLIGDGERKIQESRELAREVNKKINEAKLSVAKGLYGEHVKEVPKDDKNLTEILSDTGSIFGHNTSAAESCGNKGAGKTLINDLFCVCVGESTDAQGPCSGDILSPKKGCSNNNCNNCGNCCKAGACCGKDCCTTPCKGNCKCCGCWTQMKFQSSGNPPLSLPDSMKKIEELCKETLDETSRKNILVLLDEYVGLIEKGPKEPAAKKIFGHSGRKNQAEVKQCDGSEGSGSGGNDHHNEKICVNYANHTKDGITYNITWHEKFKNYTKIMKQSKQLEDQILKNRAALLLLKSRAWIAYSREKDDETSNLDDMNVSNLLDGTQIPPFSLLLSHLSIFF